MLVSLADIKSYLGISSGDTTYDAFLTAQGQLISDTIEAYCNRKFEVATYTQKFYNDEFGMIVKSISTFHYPLKTVTSVTEDTVALTDFRIHFPSGKLTNLLGFFSRGVKEVEVIYQAGYDVIPTPIQSVLLNLVQERYNKHISGVSLNFGSDVQSISIPGAISVQFDYSLQSNERKSAFGTLLGNYINVLDYYRSERSLIGEGVISYVS